MVVALDGAFVSEDVHTATAGINEGHPGCVRMRLAVRIVAFVASDRSRRDGDQAVARVRGPAGISTRVPDVALHVQI
jgi:hypothetical protein